MNRLYLDCFSGVAGDMLVGALLDLGADFTVLEQDPYAVAPARIKDIPIWGTVFEGEVYPVAP